MGEGPPCCLGLCPRCCYTTCKGPLLKVVAVLALVISCVWAYTWPGLYINPGALFSPYYMFAVICGVVLPCLCFAGGAAACAGVCAEERAKADQAGCRGLCFSGCYTAFTGVPLKAITVCLFILALVFTFVQPALAAGAVVAMLGWGDYSGDVVAGLVGDVYYQAAMVTGVIASCLGFMMASTACAAVCDEERKQTEVAGCRGLCCGCCYRGITGGGLKLVACLTLFVAGVWTYIVPALYAQGVIASETDENEDVNVMGILFQEVYILVLVMTITSCCLFVCGDAACAAVCAEERESLLPVVAQPPAAIVEVTPEATAVEMPAVISEPPTEAAVEEVAAAAELADGVTEDPPPAPPGMICTC